MKKFFITAIVILLATLLAVGLLVAGLYVWNGRDNPYYDPNKPHTTINGFKNLDPAATRSKSKKQRDDMRAEYSQLRKQKEKILAEAATIPIVKTDFAWLQQNETSVAFAWLGHASALLQVAGKNILIDPVFSERLAVRWVGEKRLTPVPLAIDKLPPITAVLISHNHHDHLDLYSVRYIARHHPDAIFFVPLGLKNWFRIVGIKKNVVEMDWGDQEVLQNNKTGGELAIHFVPAQHWSTRYVLDHHRSLWGGFVVAATSGNDSGTKIDKGNDKNKNKNKNKNFTFYYSGDTGYSKTIFTNIGKEFGPIDFAMIPIGAYEPRDFMKAQHGDPQEALQMADDVRAARSVGVHWGVFLLSTEGMLQPPIDLAIAREKMGKPSHEFITMKIGEIKILK